MKIDSDFQKKTSEKNEGDDTTKSGRTLATNKRIKKQQSKNKENLAKYEKGPVNTRGEGQGVSGEGGVSKEERKMEKMR
jgi:hypothetical protein